jgi:D-serine deaminase-like pyridoxal phosphate-dependent protein
MDALPPLALAGAFLDALIGVETPSVVVDGERLAINVARMAELAGVHGLRLRPHAKTHKSLVIAKLQLDGGACGLTVAKTAEAELFLSAGVPSVTIAHPLVDPAKIARAMRAASAQGADLRLIADSDAGVGAIASVARTMDAVVPVYLKVDVGLHRCGVDPASGIAITLAHRIAAEPGLRLAGLLSHAGHAYRLPDPEGLLGLAAKEREAMTALALRLREAGLEVPDVSVGCTPTVIRAEGFDGITEIRPGNYVYMDRIQVGLGVASLSEVALWVAATVVSVNDRYAIIDAGSKVLSSDRGPHGATHLEGYGLAWPTDRLDDAPMAIVSLSEEHGFIDHRGQRPQIGSRVAILPNHACTVVNLAPETVVVMPASGMIESWLVEGQSLVR